MRVGLIGAGRIGHQHAGVLHELAGELIIADQNGARADQLAARFAGANSTNVDDLLMRADAVVIASSTDTHAHFLERAAGAGIPAFCEKPISLDLASTRRAIEATRQAGIAVQMGFQRRYDPAIRAIHDAVAAGDVGHIYMIRSQTHDPEPPPLDYLPVSGGIFIDCLIHDIDAVRYVTSQEITAVTAIGSAAGFPEIGELGDVDTGLVMAQMSEGTLAQLSCIRHDPVGYDVRLEVFGSKTALAAGWGARSPIHSTEPGTTATEDPIVAWDDRFGPAYRAEMEAFLRVVAGTEQPASNALDAYEALRVAVACTRSRVEDRTVQLEEVA